MRRCRAQGTATGKYHAAVLSNDSALEAACIRAGLASGDLAHALPFAPELHFTEFTSCIADMKNSVAVPACALTPSPRLHINESRNQMCSHSGNAGSERVSFLLHCMLWVFNPHSHVMFALGILGLDTGVVRFNSRVSPDVSFIYNYIQKKYINIRSVYPAVEALPAQSRGVDVECI